MDNKLEEKEKELEEMRKLHPLVKDFNYFRTSYFPDVIPDCFKDKKIRKGGKNEK